MRRLLIALAAAIVLPAAPAFAIVTSAPVPAAGITLREMAQLMTQRGWPATISKDSSGNTVIASRVDGINFDVYLYECTIDRCTDVQFTTGWSNAVAPRITPAKVNAWNRTYRFLRAALAPGNVLTVSLDARVAYSTTANIQEYEALWPASLRQFRSFMGL